MNLLNMYNFFLVLTILTIVSQTIHTWFVFQSFSQLEGSLKTFQSVIFCGLISAAILAFVLIKKEELALTGAIIEIIINIYYYGKSFFELGIKAGSRSEEKSNRKHLRRQSIWKFWRQNWVAFFFGILLPMLIYIFAVQMIALR